MNVIRMGRNESDSLALVAKDTSAQNRQDFSHCNANVKSLLDEVLRRGSGSVKAELGRWSCRSGPDVLRTWASVRIWPDERAAF
jgi:hypothetical protein